MNTPTVYVICDQNCKFEGLTKEQIFTAITQAVSDGTIGDIDTGFVQTIKTVNGKGLKFFVGTQSEYDTLSDADKVDLFALITNDTTREGLLGAIETLQNDVAELKKCVLPKALEIDIKNGVGKILEANLLTPNEVYLVVLNGFSGIFANTLFMLRYVAIGKYYVKFRGDGGDEGVTVVDTATETTANINGKMAFYKIGVIVG